MGGGGGQPEMPDTQTTKTEPWDEQKGSLQTIFGLQAGLTGVPTDILPQGQQDTALQAGDFSNAAQRMQYFPGQTYAPFAGETEAALQGQAARGYQGSPVNQMAQAQNVATNSGQFLDAGNPYFSQMADRVTEQVMPQVQGQFAQSGRTNSGLASRALGQGLGDSIGALGYQNYSDERKNQMNAMQMAPQLAETDYHDFAALGEVGQAREALNQQGINDAIERFNFEQTEPFQRLAMFNNAVQGNMGGTSIGTQTSSGGGGSRLGSTIGSGLLGAGALASLAS